MNIMLDLETLGKNSQSVIIAIGAVAFNPESDFIDTNHFYTVVDPQSCVDHGLKLDVSTVMWWMKQSDEARAAVTREGESLPKALIAFTRWLDTVCQGRDVMLWGNGSAFDNVILANAYDACHIRRPWNYYNDMCFRTVRNQYPHVQVERQGTHHKALDDALTQARHLQAIYKEMQK
jgi:hypothetical protein